MQVERPSRTLGQLLAQQTEKALGRKDGSLPYIGLEHLATDSPDLLGVASSDSSISMNSVFDRDDILFGKLRPNLRKSVLAPFPGYCSTDILVLRARDGTDPAFSAKVMRSEPVFKEAIATAVGTKMPRTSWKVLRALEVFCPPLPEQCRIAEFLDTIDEAIRRTEEVIAKLQQMKQGLLHDLLTLGIDDNGELRDPDRYPEQFKGSPLGRIPRGWKAERIGDLLGEIEQGWSPDCPGQPAKAGEWGVLRTTAVVWDGYQDSENKALLSELPPRPEYEVRPDDVLMTRAGPNSRVGVVVLVTQTQGRLMLSDKLYRLVPSRSVLPAFLVMGLSGANTQRHLSTLKTGMAESQTNISQDIVRSLWFTVPPVPEQSAVVATHASLAQRVEVEELVLGKLRLLKFGLMEDLLGGRVRVQVHEEATT